MKEYIFNEFGVCENPETIKLPDSASSIEWCVCSDNGCTTYHYGYSFVIGTGQGSFGPCSKVSKGFPDFASMLRHAASYLDECRKRVKELGHGHWPKSLKLLQKHLCQLLEEQLQLSLFQVDSDGSLVPYNAPG